MPKTKHTHLLPVWDHSHISQTWEGQQDSGKDVNGCPARWNNKLCWNSNDTNLKNNTPMRKFWRCHQWLIANITVRRHASVNIWCCGVAREWRAKRPQNRLSRSSSLKCGITVVGPKVQLVFTKGLAGFPIRGRAVLKWCNGFMGWGSQNFQHSPLHHVCTHCPTCKRKIKGTLF